jgi:hypothetical protein
VMDWHCQIMSAMTIPHVLDYGIEIWRTEKLEHLGISFGTGPKVPHIDLKYTKLKEQKWKWSSEFLPLEPPTYRKLDCGPWKQQSAHPAIIFLFFLKVSSSGIWCYDCILLIFQKFHKKLCTAPWR